MHGLFCSFSIPVKQFNYANEGFLAEGLGGAVPWGREAQGGVLDRNSAKNIWTSYVEKAPSVFFLSH